MEEKEEKRKKEKEEKKKKGGEKIKGVGEKIFVNSMRVSTRCFMKK